MQNKLCQIIPVLDSNQLKFTGKYRKDSSISQIQLALNINNIDNGRNVKSIIDDLDTLIKNKEITQISMVEPVVYLDKDYGCKHECKITIIYIKLPVIVSNSLIHVKFFFFLANIIDQLYIAAIIIFPALFVVTSIYFISRWWCKNKNVRFIIITRYV